MVHFLEWTTSFLEKGGNRAIAPKWRVLGGRRPALFSQNTNEALPLEWQGCLLLTGLFAVFGVGDPDAGYDEEADDEEGKD